jgi:hypothetical protein
MRVWSTKVTAAAVAAMMVSAAYVHAHGPRDRREDLWAGTPAANTPPWVTKSNENTKYVLDALAEFGPEGASRVGKEGYDAEITDLKPGFRERTRTANEEVISELQKRLGAERDPQVHQDLELTIKSQQDGLKTTALQEKYFVPYQDLPQFIFFGIRTLLDDQIPPERRQRALDRLKKYAGVETGYTPTTDLVIADIRAHGQPGLLYPAKAEVERDLSNAGFLIEGIGKLFEQYKIEGYQEPYARLKEELTAYERFVKTEIQPKARTDFKLPPEVYADFLSNNYGVDIPPARLAEMAHAAFTEYQAEMQQIAARIAKEKGWADSDYRAVIGQLKKDQLVGEAILPHYQQRLKDLEQIITREKLVTLPRRPARIRLATPAESAQQPAPNMRAPRLLGNTGEQGEFVLPLNIPSSDPAQKQQYDDFTFAAASWTLTAHEARPGHELQFAKMIEEGVSDARSLFAFNSTNVEGWGLYAERIVKPFMPLDGQLISLQHRLMRAARAFSDPELQMGKVTPEQVKALLMTDVVLSDAMATQEVERYTFRAPGQATSYFYGFTRLNELRNEVETTMGGRFNQLEFHDYVLAQGLLPPALLRKAVIEHFLGPQKEPAVRQ